MQVNVKGKSGSTSVDSLGADVQEVLFAPSRHLWQVWGFDSKCDFAAPTILLGLLLCPLTWGIFFWWDPGGLLSMVVQQWVAILEFLQEKMSTHPSTPPPYWYILLIELPYDPTIPFLRILVWIWDKVSCTELRWRANSYPRAFLVDWTQKCLGSQGRWPARAVPWWVQLARVNWAAQLRNAPGYTGHFWSCSLGEPCPQGFSETQGAAQREAASGTTVGALELGGYRWRSNQLPTSPRAQRN